MLSEISLKNERTAGGNFFTHFLQTFRQSKLASQIGLTYASIVSGTIIFLNVIIFVGLYLSGPEIFDEETSRRLLEIFLIANVITLVAVSVAGYFAIKKFLHPLEKVAETAQEISDGKITGRILISESGKEIDELSRTFNTVPDKFDRGLKQQQRFLADISHELRTPITIVRGYADMLESYGAEDAELLKESVNSIKNSSKHMQNLVESLLFIARAEQGTQLPEKIPTDINELLKSTVEKFNNPRIEFSGEENCEMNADPNFLSEMFSEFLDNAIKYSKEKISVELTKKNNFAFVKFIDRGIGMSPEDTEKIFDRFFRVDKSRTACDDEEENSAGLGLSKAKLIADMHDIKIDVTSEEGKGSTFELTIPLN